MHLLCAEAHECACHAAATPSSHHEHFFDMAVLLKELRSGEGRWVSRGAWMHAGWQAGHRKRRRPCSSCIPCEGLPLRSLGDSLHANLAANARPSAHEEEEAARSGAIWARVCGAPPTNNLFSAFGSRPAAMPRCSGPQLLPPRVAGLRGTQTVVSPGSSGQCGVRGVPRRQAGGSARGHANVVAGSAAEPLGLTSSKRLSRRR